MEFHSLLTELTATDITQFRLYCPLGINEIRTRAREGLALLEIRPFTTDWELDRVRLAEIVREILTKSLAWTVWENGQRLDDRLLRNRIQMLRGIEVEQELQVRRELGNSEPVEDDVDWTAGV